MSESNISERDSLLSNERQGQIHPPGTARRVVWSILILAFSIGLVLVLRFGEYLPWTGTLPKDPVEAALRVLDISPTIVSQLPLLRLDCHGREMSQGRSHWYESHTSRALTLIHTFTFLRISFGNFVDLPMLIRIAYANNISAIDMYTMPGHVDIPRLRTGHVGGVFWYVPLCFQILTRDGHAKQVCIY